MMPGALIARRAFPHAILDGRNARLKDRGSIAELSSNRFR